MKNKLLLLSYAVLFTGEMAARITDPQQLSIAIGKWVQYTWYRVVLWSLEWVTMMYYFAARAYQTLERS